QRGGGVYGTGTASERLKRRLFAGAASLAFDKQLREAVEVTHLGRFRRPGFEVIALERGGHERRAGKKTARFTRGDGGGRGGLAMWRGASRVASRKAAWRSAVLISFSSSGGDFAGKPKRRWMAASNRRSTDL